MELLEKTRKINKLLQKGDNVEYNAIAKLLCDVIQANTYIADRDGHIKGYALIQCLFGSEENSMINRWPECEERRYVAMFDNYDWLIP